MGWNMNLQGGHTKDGMVWVHVPFSEKYNAALDALRVLVDHAKETYPHFESERGQRDIAQAEAVLNRP